MSETLAPPTMATNGLAGSCSKSPSTSTSRSSSRPAADGSLVGGPTTEACARWRRAEGVVHVDVEPLHEPVDELRVVRRLTRVEAQVLLELDLGSELGEDLAQRLDREGGIGHPLGLPRWVHAVTCAPWAKSHEMVGMAALIRKSSSTVGSPSVVRRAERDVEVDTQQDPGAVEWRKILEERKARQRTLLGSPSSVRAAPDEDPGRHEVLPSTTSRTRSTSLLA